MAFGSWAFTLPDKSYNTHDWSCSARVGDFLLVRFYLTYSSVYTEQCVTWNIRPIFNFVDQFNLILLIRSLIISGKILNKGTLLSHIPTPKDFFQTPIFNHCNNLAISYSRLHEPMNRKGRSSL